jgi:hypothetical protein
MSDQSMPPEPQETAVPPAVEPPVSPYAQYADHPRHVGADGQSLAWTADGYLAKPGDPAAAMPLAPRENVALGLLFSLGGVVLGCLATWVAWRLGFIASITSFVIAIASVALYTKGAGSAPRKGLVPLLLVIVFGVVGSFYTMYISDLSAGYDQVIAGSYAVSKGQFISDNLFNTELIKAYGTDLLFFVGFAVLGVFGTMRRLLASI